MKNNLPLIISLALVFATRSLVAQTPPDTQTIEQLSQEDESGEFVPLSELKPLDVDHEIVNTHILDGGLSAANTYYVDSVLKNNLYLGFYRPYLRYIYEEKQDFLVKGKMTLKRFDKKPTSGKQTTVVGTLEMAQAKLTFDRHHVLAGRFFHKLGKGVLFSNYADGVEYSFLHPMFQLKVAGLYSGDYGSACGLSIQGCSNDQNPYEVVPNIPVDAQAKDSGKRWFTSVEIGSPSFFGSRFNLLGLYSKDMISESDSATQKYAYNPWYAGAGLRGFIITPALRYSTEGYYLGGTTFPKKGTTFTGKEKVDISAYALQAEVKYSLPWLKEVVLPVLIAQYAMGSGDKDKTSLSTPSATNLAGKDNSFYYFGTYSAGLGLKPQLSNLQLYRFGFSMKPFVWTQDFKSVAFIAKYSIYRKIFAEGAISDTLATEKNKDVGSAVDFTFVYKVTSELNVFYSFGMFMPGKAYPEKTSKGENGRKLRQVHLVSLTVSF